MFPSDEGIEYRRRRCTRLQQDVGVIGHQAVRKNINPACSGSRQQPRRDETPQRLILEIWRANSRAACEKTSDGTAIANKIQTRWARCHGCGLCKVGADPPGCIGGGVE